MLRTLGSYTFLHSLDPKLTFKPDHQSGADQYVSAVESKIVPSFRGFAGPTRACGRQRRLSGRRCAATPAIISVGDCRSTVWKSVGGEVVGAGLASDRILLVN
jgi:hypothetical protein